MTNWLTLILIAEVIAGLVLVLVFWLRTQSQNRNLRKSADKALRYQLADRVQPVVDETFEELRIYITNLHKQLEKNFAKEQESILNDLAKMGGTQQKELEKKLEKTITDASEYWQRFMSEQQRTLQNEVEQTHQQHLAHLSEIHAQQYAQLEKMYQEQEQALQARMQQKAMDLEQASQAAVAPLIGQKLAAKLSNDEQHDLAMQLLTDFIRAKKATNE
jgi:lysyl-tRNA synthetase class I